MKSLFTVFFCICTSLLFAQDFLWLDRMGTGAGYEGVDVVTADNNGYAYIGGGFAATTDMDPSAGTINMTCFGYVDCFISKFDENGTIIWSKQFGGNDFEVITDLIVDNLGNIYACGYYSSTTFDADPNAGVYNLNGNAEQSFILKLDENGTLVWAFGFGSTGQDRANALDFDTNGNIVIGGAFANTVDFNFSVANFNITSAPAGSGYVLKIKPDGVFVSAVALGTHVTSLEITEFGQLHVAGYFAGTTDLDPSAGMSIYTSTGITNGFVCTLDPGNSLYWSKAFSGDSNVKVDKLAIGENSDVIVMLRFDNNISLDPNSGVLTNTVATNDVAIVSLYKFTGDHKWSKHIGGTGEDFGTALVTDENDFIYYIVNFNDVIDADPGLAEYNFTSTAYYDFYVGRLAPNGDFTWANQLGSIYSELGSSLYCDANETFYMAGFFNGTVDFDMGPGVANSTSSGSNADAFLGRYTICSPIYSSISETGCESYVSPSGNYIWTASGTYTDTIFTSVSMCDSIITCNITIVNIDTTITQTSGTFTSNQTGASYQWVTCPGEVPVVGATNQSFTPTANGTYMVLTTLNGCVDSSACVTINDVGISEDEKLQFELYPNPARNQVGIFSNYIMDEIFITDVSGNIVIQMNEVNLMQMQIDISKMTSGIYLIEIHSGNNIVVKKLHVI